MIIIIGNSFFGKKVARAIRKNSNTVALYFDTSNSIRDKVLFVFFLIFCSSLYSISGSIKKGGALSLALLLKKKIHQHFIGSDVTEAIADFSNKNYSRELISNSSFYCEVSWIKDEVEEYLPIKCDLLDLPILHGLPLEIKKTSSKENKVLVYIGEGKEDFYGINDILYSAKNLQHIDFIIVGSNCLDYRSEASDNISFLGWVDEPIELMKVCSVLIRFTAHDGLPFSIIEALSLGLHVIYNRPFTGCLLAKDKDEIKNHLMNIFNSDEIALFNKIGYYDVRNRYCTKLVVNKILEKIL